MTEDEKICSLRRAEYLQTLLVTFSHGSFASSAPFVLFVQLIKSLWSSCKFVFYDLKKKRDTV